VAFGKAIGCGGWNLKSRIRNPESNTHISYFE
jgi:hypothetical protein